MIVGTILHREKNSLEQKLNRTLNKKMGLSSIILSHLHRIYGLSFDHSSFSVRFCPSRCKIDLKFSSDRVPSNPPVVHFDSVSVLNKNERVVHVAFHRLFHCRQSFDGIVFLSKYKSDTRTNRTIVQVKSNIALCDSFFCFSRTQSADDMAALYINRFPLCRQQIYIVLQQIELTLLPLKYLSERTDASLHYFLNGSLFFAFDLNKMRELLKNSKLFNNIDG